MGQLLAQRYILALGQHQLPSDQEEALVRYRSWRTAGGAYESPWWHVQESTTLLAKVDVLGFRPVLRKR